MSSTFHFEIMTVKVYCFRLTSTLCFFQIKLGFIGKIPPYKSVQSEHGIIPNLLGPWLQYPKKSSIPMHVSYFRWFTIHIEVFNATCFWYIMFFGIPGSTFECFPNCYKTITKNVYPWYIRITFNVLRVYTAIVCLTICTYVQYLFAIYKIWLRGYSF